VILDLEDSVAPSAKREARETAFALSAGISPGSPPVALRVQFSRYEVWADDLQAGRVSVDPDYLLLRNAVRSRAPGMSENLCERQVRLRKFSR